MSSRKEGLISDEPNNIEYGSVENNQQTSPETLMTPGKSSPNSVTPLGLDLHEIYEKMGVGPAQYLYWTTTALIGYSDFAELTLLSVALPSIRCEWGLSTGFEAGLTMAVFISYAVFAIVCGRLSDIFGRKVVVATSDFVLILAAGASAAAPNKWVFLVCRIVTGACVGINMSGIACYATEFAESKRRTVGVAVLILASLGGYLLINVLALAMIQTAGWRWFIVVASLPALPVLAMLVYLPDSPRYLCYSGQQEKAREAIKFMARLNKVSLPENFNVLCSESEDLGSYKMVFSKEYIRSTVCLTVIYFMDIFLEFGLIIFLPLYFSSGICGATVSEPPQHVCTPLSTDDLYKLTITSSLSIGGAIATFFISNKVGRLLPIRAASVIQTIGLACILICFNSTFSFVVIVFTKTVQVFVNTSVWIIMPESFPTSIRSTAVGVINGAGKIGGVLGTGCVELLFYTDPNIVLGLFLAASVIGIVGAFVLNKDTKDNVLI